MIITLTQELQKTSYLGVANHWVAWTAKLLNLSIATIYSALLLLLFLILILTIRHLIKKYQPKYVQSFELAIQCFGCIIIFYVSRLFKDYISLYDYKLVIITFILTSVVFAKSHQERLWQLLYGGFIYFMAMKFFAFLTPQPKIEEIDFSIGPKITEIDVRNQKNHKMKLDTIDIYQNGIDFKIISANPKSLSQYLKMNLYYNNSKAIISSKEDHFTINDAIEFKINRDQDRENTIINLNFTNHSDKAQDLSSILFVDLFDTQNIAKIEKDGIEKNAHRRDIYCLHNDKVTYCGNSILGDIEWVGYQTNHGCLSNYIVGDFKECSHRDNLASIKLKDLTLQPGENRTVVLQLVSTASVSDIEVNYPITKASNLFINGIFKGLYRILFMSVEYVARYVNAFIGFFAVMFVFMCIVLFVYELLRRYILKLLKYDGLLDNLVNQSMVSMQQKIAKSIITGHLTRKLFSYLVLFIFFVVKTFIIFRIIMHCFCSGIFYNTPLLFIKDISSDFTTTIGDLLNIAPLHSKNIILNMLYWVINSMSLNIDLLLLLTVIVTALLISNKSNPKITITINQKQSQEVVWIVPILYCISKLIGFSQIRAVSILALQFTRFIDNYIQNII